MESSDADSSPRAGTFAGLIHLSNYVMQVPVQSQQPKLPDSTATVSSLDKETQMPSMRIRAVNSTEEEQKSPPSISKATQMPSIKERQDVSSNTIQSPSKSLTSTKGRGASPVKIRKHRLWAEHSTHANSRGRARTQVNAVLANLLPNHSLTSDTDHKLSHLNISKQLSRDSSQERQQIPAHIPPSFPAVQLTSSYVEQPRELKSSQSAGSKSRPEPRSRERQQPAGNGSNRENAIANNLQKLRQLRRHRLWQSRQSSASPERRAAAEVASTLMAYHNSIQGKCKEASPGKKIKKDALQFAADPPGVQHMSHEQHNRYHHHHQRQQQQQGYQQPYYSFKEGNDTSDVMLGGVYENEDQQSAASTKQYKDTAGRYGATVEKLQKHRLWRKRESSASPERRAEARLKNVLGAWVVDSDDNDSTVVKPAVTGSTRQQHEKQHAVFPGDQTLEFQAGTLYTGFDKQNAKHAKTINRLRDNRHWRGRDSNATPERRAASQVVDLMTDWAQHAGSKSNADDLQSVGQQVEAGIRPLEKGFSSVCKTPSLDHSGSGIAHVVSGDMDSQQYSKTVDRVKKHRLWQQRESSASPEQRAANQLRGLVSDWKSSAVCHGEVQQAQRPMATDSMVGKQCSMDTNTDNVYAHDVLTSSPNLRGRGGLGSIVNHEARQSCEVDMLALQRMQQHRLWRERESSASPEQRRAADVTNMLSAYFASDSTNTQPDVPSRHDCLLGGLLCARDGGELQDTTMGLEAVLDTRHTNQQPACHVDALVHQQQQATRQQSQLCHVTTRHYDHRQEALARLQQHRLWRERESSASPERRHAAAVCGAMADWAAGINNNNSDTADIRQHTSHSRLPLTTHADSSELAYGRSPPAHQHPGSHRGQADLMPRDDDPTWHTTAQISDRYVHVMQTGQLDQQDTACNMHHNNSRDGQDVRASLERLTQHPLWKSRESSASPERRAAAKLSHLFESWAGSPGVEHTTAHGTTKPFDDGVYEHLASVEVAESVLAAEASSNPSLQPGQLYIVMPAPQGQLMLQKLSNVNPSSNPGSDLQLAQMVSVSSRNGIASTLQGKERQHQPSIFEASTDSPLSSTGRVNVISSAEGQGLRQVADPCLVAQQHITPAVTGSDTKQPTDDNFNGSSFQDRHDFVDRSQGSREETADDNLPNLTLHSAKTQITNDLDGVMARLLRFSIQNDVQGDKDTQKLGESCQTLDRDNATPTPMTAQAMTSAKPCDIETVVINVKPSSIDIKPPRTEADLASTVNPMRGTLQGRSILEPNAYVYDDTVNNQSALVAQPPNAPLSWSTSSGIMHPIESTAATEQEETDADNLLDDKLLDKSAEDSVEIVHQALSVHSLQAALEQLNQVDDVPSNEGDAVNKQDSEEQGLQHHGTNTEVAVVDAAIAVPVKNATRAITRPAVIPPRRLKLNFPKPTIDTEARHPNEALQQEVGEVLRSSDPFTMHLDGHNWLVPRNNSNSNNNSMDGHPVQGIRGVRVVSPVKLERLLQPIQLTARRPTTELGTADNHTNSTTNNNNSVLDLQQPVVISQDQLSASHQTNPQQQLYRPVHSSVETSISGAILQHCPFDAADTWNQTSPEHATGQVCDVSSIDLGRNDAYRNSANTARSDSVPQQEQELELIAHPSPTTCWQVQVQMPDDDSRAMGADISARPCDSLNQWVFPYERCITAQPQAAGTVQHHIARMLCLEEHEALPTALQPVCGNAGLPTAFRHQVGELTYDGGRHGTAMQSIDVGSTFGLPLPELDTGSNQAVLTQMLSCPESPSERRCAFSAVQVPHSFASDTEKQRPVSPNSKHRAVSVMGTSNALYVTRWTDANVAGVLPNTPTATQPPPSANTHMSSGNNPGQHCSEQQTVDAAQASLMVCANEPLAVSIREAAVTPATRIVAEPMTGADLQELLHLALYGTVQEPIGITHCRELQAATLNSTTTEHRAMANSKDSRPSALYPGSETSLQQPTSNADCNHPQAITLFGSLQQSTAAVKSNGPPTTTCNGGLAVSGGLQPSILHAAYPVIMETGNGPLTSVNPTHSPVRQAAKPVVDADVFEQIQQLPFQRMLNDQGQAGSFQEGQIPLSQLRKPESHPSDLLQITAQAAGPVTLKPESTSTSHPMALERITTTTPRFSKVVCDSALSSPMHLQTYTASPARTQFQVWTNPSYSVAPSLPLPDGANQQQYRPQQEYDQEYQQQKSQQQQEALQPDINLSDRVAETAGNGTMRDTPQSMTRQSDTALDHVDNGSATNNRIKEQYTSTDLVSDCIVQELQQELCEQQNKASETFSSSMRIQPETVAVTVEKPVIPAQSNLSQKGKTVAESPALPVRLGMPTQLPTARRLSHRYSAVQDSVTVSPQPVPRPPSTAAVDRLTHEDAQQQVSQSSTLDQENDDRNEWLLPMFKSNSQDQGWSYTAGKLLHANLPKEQAGLLNQRGQLHVVDHQGSAATRSISPTRLSLQLKATVSSPTKVAQNADQHVHAKLSATITAQPSRKAPEPQTVAAQSEEQAYKQQASYNDVGSRQVAPAASYVMSPPQQPQRKRRQWAQSQMQDEGFHLNHASYSDWNVAMKLQYEGGAAMDAAHPHGTASLGSNNDTSLGSLSKHASTLLGTLDASAHSEQKLYSLPIRNPSYQHQSKTAAQQAVISRQEHESPDNIPRPILRGSITSTLIDNDIDSTWSFKSNGTLNSPKHQTELRHHDIRNPGAVFRSDSLKGKQGYGLTMSLDVSELEHAASAVASATIRRSDDSQGLHAINTHRLLGQSNAVQSNSAHRILDQDLRHSQARSHTAELIARLKLANIATQSLNRGVGLGQLQ